MKVNRENIIRGKEWENEEHTCFYCLININTDYELNNLNN